MRKTKLKIEGMHCASCEVLIERRFKKIHGIKRVSVDHATGEAELWSSKEPDINKLQEAVQDQGYTVHNGEIPQHNSPRDYAQIGGIFLLFIAAYLLLKRFDLIPAISISQNMSYGLIFVIGLIAATSTCLAVTGGLLLAIAAKHSERYPHLTRAQKFRPHIYFNVGRIVSYTLFGALLGALGSLFVFSPTVSGFVVIIASLLMIVIGVQMLHIFPNLSKVKVKMPKFLAHRIYEKGSKEYRPAAPFLLGASSFFLPCGFTQALQLYVLTTGNWVVGGLTMLVFSLGTLPSLLSLGAISSFLNGGVQRQFLRFAAVLVILLGVLSIGSGFTLIGAGSIFGKDTGNIVPILDGQQVAKMRIVGLEYEPHAFTVIQGVPVRWEIDAREAEGCASVISVPRLGIVEQLPRDKVKVIEFTPDQTGAISFSCTMGMTTPGSAFEVVKATA
jgi:uncharacterized protein